MIHEIGHNLGLRHENNGTGDIMNYDKDRVGHFNQLQAQQIFNLIQHNKLNQGTNTQKSQSTSNNWFFHTSSNDEPYIKNVKKGDIIPTIIHND